LQAAARAVVLLTGVAVIAPVADAIGAEPYECIELSVGGTEGAKFTNICNEMMNLMYCVNNPQSPKTCSAERLGITTLVPLASEIVPDYTTTGGGEIFVAICTYPTAPVGWKPERDSPFECKKTCVMC
jgi:hypothetical protein